jgi:glycosyltransferase involved in cell wall biosynthesis
MSHHVLPPLPPDASKGDAKVVVVMPARNAARTLEATIGAIPMDWVDDLLLVDDASTDETLALARSIPGLHVIWHPHNVGYGGNQKTCYLDALQRDADVVVMLHPDGQYAPELIPSMVHPILAGEADIVLGSRFLPPRSALAGGMPRHKWVANRALSTVQNAMLGTGLSEFHTGYRAYSRRFLLGIPFLRNHAGFSFDSEVLLQAVHFGFRIGEVPVRTRYFEEASSIGLRPSVVYALRTLAATLRLRAHRRGLLPSPRFRP